MAYKALSYWPLHPLLSLCTSHSSLHLGHTDLSSDPCAFHSHFLAFTLAVPITNMPPLQIFAWFLPSHHLHVNINILPQKAFPATLSS